MMNCCDYRTQNDETFLVKENQSVVSEDTDKTSDTRKSHPPPNAPSGGVWGTIKYNGEKSKKRNQIGCALLIIPGLVMMACPKDEKDAYAVWEHVSQLLD
jgi:hypothetical protein